MAENRPLLALPLTLSLAWFWGCGEGPTQVDLKKANQPPETYISSATLSKVELEIDSTGSITNLNEFSYTLEYTAYDADGKVDSFAIRVDGGSWSSWTEKTKSTGTINIASLTEAHAFEVKAKDNDGAEDPAPASTTLTLSQISANKSPATTISSGPPNGTASSPGVKIEVSGADEDGKVLSFVYSLDGGVETSVPTDDNGKAVIEFSSRLGNLLSLGNHSISILSVDNLGARDPTPEIRSFLATSGFKPILAQTGGPFPGGGWFTGTDVPFRWNVSMAHYSGVIDRFEYSVDDPANFTSITSPQVSLPPQPAGNRIFRLRAIDTAGNASDLLEVGFEVALFAPTEGILFIDNVDANPSTAAYVDEPDSDQKTLNGFFKNFTRVSVWDVDRLSGSSRFPGAINTNALPGPSDLAKYSSVVIMTDAAYDIDNISTLLAAYFQAGGNLMITGFRTADFGQVLKDVMGTPTIGVGADFKSLEGFQTASSTNSNVYAFISGPDIIPLIPGVPARSWEITSNVTARKSLRILFANVGPAGNNQGSRIATEIEGGKGNWGIWLGMSLVYLDQASSGIVKLGDFILGSRFKER
jgi:hypothetical protein